MHQILGPVKVDKVVKPAKGKAAATKEQ
jgi:hypothetical protein